LQANIQLLIRTGGKTLQEVDFRTLINRIGNDFKIGIDDLISVILSVKEDVENLKIKTSKPDKPTARALLEYLSMEPCKAKENMELFLGKQISFYFKWLDIYCDENSCTREQALTSVINGQI
jgi:hypothetical protein